MEGFAPVNDVREKWTLPQSHATQSVSVSGQISLRLLIRQGRANGSWEGAAVRLFHVGAVLIYLTETGG